MPRIDDAEKEIIDFARHNNITAVHRGVNPEEGNRTYYLVNPGPYDRILEDKVSVLDIQLARKGASLDLLLWPSADVKGCAFIHECVYAANPNRGNG
jgi:hypothetical protein